MNKAIFTLMISMLFILVANAQYAPSKEIYTKSGDALQLNQTFHSEDFDQDGYNDILYSRSSSSLNIIEKLNGDGYSNYTNQDTIYSINNVEITDLFHLSDINMDGVPDVLFSYKNPADTTQGIAWYYGNGDGTLQSQTNIITIPLEFTYFSVEEIVDIDNDGNNDLLVSLHKPSTTSAYSKVTVNVAFNNGFGDFNVVKTVANNLDHIADNFFGSPDIQFIAAAADLDGDLDKDIAIHSNIQTSAISTIKNLGNRNFGFVIPYVFTGVVATFNVFQDLEIHDLDGDGKDELFVSITMRDICIFHCGAPIIENYFIIFKYNQNTGLLNIKKQFNSLPHEYEDDLDYKNEYGDVDHDGNIDILKYNPSTNTLLWFLGEGDGNFIDVMIVSTQAGIVNSVPSLKADDIDNDGDLDVLVLNNGSSINNILLFENLEFHPDHDMDGIDVLTDCHDENDLISDVLSPIQIVAPSAQCEGEGFQFQIGNLISDLDYNWTGPNGYISTEPMPLFGSLALGDDGIYEVQSSINSCVSLPTSTNLSVGAYPDVQITETGNILTAISPTAIAFQWYLNDNIISGATSSTYTYSETGDYSVSAISENGCATISEPISIIVSGLKDDLISRSILVYPNPVNSNSILTVNLKNGELQSGSYILLNVLGEAIKTGEFSSQIFKISLENNQIGSYILQIESKGNVINKFISIQ